MMMLTLLLSLLLLLVFVADHPAVSLGNDFDDVLTRAVILRLVL